MAAPTDSADPADGSPHHWMAANNRAPIAEAMRTLVPPASAAAQGLALEIGSGTGAQLEALAETYPGLSWRPSEYCAGQSVVRGFYEQGADGPDPGHPVEKVRGLADLDAVLGKYSNVLPAVELDGSAPYDSWPSSVVDSGPGAYALIFCSNVVHIAPWAVAEGIFAGAGRALRAGGSLVFHGPYKRDGKCEGMGHEQLWDEQMRSFGKDWGIRDVDDMAAEAAKHGMRLATTEHPIGPAKNFLLQFVKEAAKQ